MLRTPVNGCVGVAMDSVDERLQLSKLARRRASLEREVAAEGLVRFAALCRQSSAIRIHLRFRLDAKGRTQMDGRLAAEVNVQCHRCLVPASARLRSDFSVVIVRDGDEADHLGRRFAVLQVAGEEASLGELIEDELILSLPQRPCTDAACPQAPPRTFPADAPQLAHKPFQALGLLSASGDNA